MRRAILDLKIQRDKLRQYQKRITVLTDRETQIAKQMLAQGDKKRALLALRRKKYQESLLSKTDSQLEQLEKLTSSVEFALIQKDVLFGLQQGTKVLKEIHAEMGGIEHVEKLMGESADAIAYQKVSRPPYVLLEVMSLIVCCSLRTGGKRDAWGQDFQSGRRRGRRRARGARSRGRRAGAGGCSAITQRARYGAQRRQDAGWTGTGTRKGSAGRATGYVGVVIVHRYWCRRVLEFGYLCW